MRWPPRKCQAIIIAYLQCAVKTSKLRRCNSRIFSWPPGFCPGRPGGGAAACSPPPRTPRGRLGRPWRRPLWRRRRARITAYLQWILSTGASQEGPLEIGLGASDILRRRIIHCKIGGAVARTKMSSQNHCTFTVSRENVEDSKMEKKGADWKIEASTFARHIVNMQ